ncbi:MAG: hypothetical protein PHE77_00550 [Candidatus Pacebacteria bacterium]|nr:hypothetical protein [Candidatus Paceibacterota bacterium]
MKKIIIFILVIAVVLAIAITVDLKFFNQPEQIACTQEAMLCPDGSYVGRVGPDCEFAPCPEQNVNDAYKNISYEIEGQTITLINGAAEEDIIPGSASKKITQYFGNEAAGDFNGDGFSDVAFLLTQNNGGSGTFYYIVAALATSSGYQGTNAVLLGDRIAPQTTEFQNGEIIVNFADRNPDEPMSAVPLVGVSKYFKIIDEKLIEVEQ